MYSLPSLCFIVIPVYASMIGEIKPQSDASAYNTYIWDGRELKPKAGANI